MDRVEKEIQKVLYRVYPAIGEVFISVDAFRGRVQIRTEQEMWFFCSGKRWLAGLYRASHRKNFRGLSIEIETAFRQAAVHAQISKWVYDNFQRQQQSAAQSQAWAGIQYGRN